MEESLQLIAECLVSIRVFAGVSTILFIYWIIARRAK